MTSLISVLQMGHPAPMVDSNTAFAQQYSQKRACPHGTNVNPSRDAIKQTSLESDATDALGTGDGDVAGVGLDGVVSGSVACSPSLFPGSIRLCRPKFLAPLIAPFELNL